MKLNPQGTQRNHQLSTINLQNGFTLTAINCIIFWYMIDLWFGTKSCRQRSCLTDVQNWIFRSSGKISRCPPELWQDTVCLLDWKLFMSVLYPAIKTIINPPEHWFIVARLIEVSLYMLAATFLFNNVTFLFSDVSAAGLGLIIISVLQASPFFINLFFSLPHWNANEYWNELCSLTLKHIMMSFIQLLPPLSWSH